MPTFLTINMNIYTTKYLNNVFLLQKNLLQRKIQRFEGRILSN